MSGEGREAVRLRGRDVRDLEAGRIGGWGTGRAGMEEVGGER